MTFFPSLRRPRPRPFVQGTFRPQLEALEDRCLPTVYVTNTNDSGAGSLRQAILKANSTPAFDQIAFRIHGQGVHTIQPQSSLPAVTRPVLINGYSQLGAQPNTLAKGDNAKLRIQIDGSMAGPLASGLTLAGGVCVVRGLVIDHFAAGIHVTGGIGVIRGNFIGTNAAGTAAVGNVDGVLDESRTGCRIGGPAPASRNVISGNLGSGIAVRLAQMSVVAGNFIGTNAAGTAALGNRSHGVEINGSPGNRIGGPLPGDRNVIAGNRGDGILITGSGARGNLVQGNFIGTDVAGSHPLGNALNGVEIDGAALNEVSGKATAGGPFFANNVIAANGGDGVRITGGGAALNRVRDNYIGTDLSGSIPLGNAGDGVYVGAGANHNSVGGGASSRYETNVIAFSGGAGVRVADGVGNLVRSNAIHDSNGLGIDLGPAGVTPNDAGDADAGANDLQNFPILSGALTVNGLTTMTGTVHGTPNTFLFLDFYANVVADPTGHGEARFWLGPSVVTTDGAGDASFAVSLSATLPGAAFYAATATDPGGNTSELSACVAEGSAP